MSAVSFAEQATELEEPQSHAGQSATWQTKEVKFWYAGYSTYYNCDAFEKKIEVLLLEFGAAPDIDVRATGCFGANDVEKHISVKLRFSVPMLLLDSKSLMSDGSVQSSQNATVISAQHFQANLRPVSIKHRKPRMIERGDCELVEHFVRYVLPEFNPEKIKNKPRCFRGSVNHHSLSLSAQVLKRI